MFDFKIFKTCRLNLILESVIENIAPNTMSRDKCMWHQRQTQFKLDGT